MTINSDKRMNINSDKLLYRIKKAAKEGEHTLLVKVKSMDEVLDIGAALRRLHILGSTNKYFTRDAQLRAVAVGVRIHEHLYTESGAYRTLYCTLWWSQTDPGIPIESLLYINNIKHEGDL